MYPIREAARRTGLSEVQLRTWERRYGLGPSTRSAGGHRRYTEADLARLTYAARLVADGVGPAGAAAKAIADRAVPPPPFGTGFDPAAIDRLRQQRLDAVAARQRAVAVRQGLLHERDRLVAQARTRTRERARSESR